LQARNIERPKSSVTSHVNQVKTFVSLVQVNDLVVTVNSERLHIGRVTGEAFIKHGPLTIERGGQRYAMTHHLRRHVAWGPGIPRKSVPAALEMTMLAHQTVFNIDAYWDLIYHLLYPCFQYAGKLYLSANIKQTQELDNYSISQFFSLLSGIEAMAKDFESGDESWKTYPDIAGDKLEKLNLNLTTKAEFMSPGAIWAAVSSDGGALIWTAAIYLMVFGGDIKIFKTDGVIDIKTRQKIWDRVLKLMDVHKFPKVKQKLRIDVPRVETEVLKPPRVRKPKTGSTVLRLEATPKKTEDVDSNESGS
jgi:hypothetical protein